MKYRFIGWCKEGTHDKVWGVIKLQDNQCLTFWGRRGAKLQTKIVYDNWDLDTLIRRKRNNGYDEIYETELEDVYPEFEQDLEKTAIWATLKL